MVRLKRNPLLASTLLAITFTGGLALAQEGEGMTERGRMMGDSSHSSMMGMNRAGMMGRGMESCIRMMQGVRTGDQRPNEQWRQRQP
jgi:hypothetical protein